MKKHFQPGNVNVRETFHSTTSSFGIHLVYYSGNAMHKAQCAQCRTAPCQCRWIFTIYCKNMRSIVTTISIVSKHPFKLISKKLIFFIKISTKNKSYFLLRQVLYHLHIYKRTGLTFLIKHQAYSSQ